MKWLQVEFVNKFITYFHKAFFLLTISFPVYIFHFYQNIFIDAQKKVASNFQIQKHLNFSIKFDLIQRIKKINWFHLLAFFGSLILLLGLIVVQWDGIIFLWITLTSLLITCYYWYQKIDQWLINKKNKLQKQILDINYYKTYIFSSVYLILTILIALILLILFFQLNKQSKWEIDNIIFDHSSSLLSYDGTNNFVTISSFDLSSFFLKLDAQYGHLGINVVILISAILVGLTFWWLGISSIIFLYLTKTYQPLVYWLTYHLNDVTTWGLLTSFFLGFIFGVTIFFWLKNFKPIEQKLLTNFYWLLTTSNFVFNLILWGKSYFFIYHWMWYYIIIALGLFIIFLVLNFWVWFKKKQLLIIEQKIT
ncbi:hypothetical protein MCAV_03950 [[Mycoplasma] cavipharyngis]|uniref:hypothetical protein n=1 Tax=[Mycoplasma] cavipharyngis TaxID=92757 RepID=UPI0037048A85